jgi:chaperone BCS1
MCAMYVSEQDSIYNHIMKFMSQLPSIKRSQYLTAQTVWKSAWEEEDDADEALKWTDAGEGEGGPKYLNFANQAAKSVRTTLCTAVPVPASAYDYDA